MPMDISRAAAFFTLAGMWGRDMQPLLRLPIAPQLKSGFARATDSERFLVQLGTVTP